MDMENKKPGLAVVIAMKHRKMREEQGKEEGKGKFAEMAQEILDAVRNDDAEELAACLKSFVKVCSYDESCGKGEDSEY